MFVYKYDVVDAAGNRFSGYICSKSVELACANLKVKSWKIISVKKAFLQTLFFFHKVSLNQLSVWSDSVFQLLKVGISLNKVFDMVVENSSGFLKAVSIDMKMLINKGSSFSKACSLHRNVFGDLFIGLMEMSESTGSLKDAFEYMSKHYNFLFNIKRKIWMAFYYPLLITVIMMPIALFFLTYLMPIFSQMIEECGGQVPALTKILCFIGFGLSENWSLLMIFVGFGLLLCVLLINRYNDLWFNFILRLPLIGRLTHYFYLSMFFHVFEAMLKSGMSLVKALDIGASLMKGSFKKDLQDIKSQILLGKNFQDAMQGHRFFTALSGQIMKIGENSGDLNQVNKQLAEIYDQKLKDGLEKISQSIQPVFVSLLGGLFLMIVFGGIVPLYQTVNIFG